MRVIEYRLETKQVAGPPLDLPPSATPTTYRLITSILDPAEASAQELAALYPQRWEIETAYDEWKTHMRERCKVLRSQTPELVEQEFWGFLLAHYAVRKLVYQAAVERKEDPDDYSFTHVLRVIRRKIAGSGPPFPPPAAPKMVDALREEIAEQKAERSRGRRTPRCTRSVRAQPSPSNPGPPQHNPVAASVRALSSKCATMSLIKRYWRLACRDGVLRAGRAMPLRFGKGAPRSAAMPIGWPCPRGLPCVADTGRLSPCPRYALGGASSPLLAGGWNSRTTLTHRPRRGVTLARSE